jgi:Cu2+-exporting ATPase
VREPSQPCFAPDAARRPEATTPNERTVALHLPDIRCRGCGRRVEALLRALPGVAAATVRWRRERAEIRYDGRRTSERALTTALAQAGYDVTGPARGTGRARGVEVAVAVLALAGIVVLAAAGGGTLAAGAGELGLGAIAVGVAGAALGRRVLGLMRRGVLDRDALALVAAAAGLALATHDLVFHRLPDGLGALGLRLAPHPPVPGAGFAAAAAIAATALAARWIEDALRRRTRRLWLAAATAAAPAGTAVDAEVGAVLGRLAESELAPADGTWEDAAVRGVVTAALGCASFAVVTHGLLGGGPLAPLAVSAAVAVLVVASPAAILVAAPAARAIAVLRARAAGVLVRDPEALLQLAGVDVVCLAVRGDLAQAAIPALRGRGVRAHAIDGFGPSERALCVREAQRDGARVLLVGDGGRDPAGLAADVTVGLVEGPRPGGARARIVITGNRLDKLPELLDLGRALRAVLRQNAALAAGYNVALIPAAALGYVPPAAAAGLALLEAALGLGNAARLLRAVEA